MNTETRYEEYVKQSAPFWNSTAVEDIEKIAELTDLRLHIGQSAGHPLLMFIHDKEASNELTFV